MILCHAHAAFIIKYSLQSAWTYLAQQRTGVLQYMSQLSWKASRLTNGKAGPAVAVCLCFLS